MDHRSARPICEAPILMAWQHPLATAAQPPWRAQTLRPHGEALLPRFAAWYGQLQAWPRRLRRALQRQLALPLAGVALLLALGQAPAQAATMAVDGTMCTLVDAIKAANTDTDRAAVRPAVARTPWCWSPQAAW